MTDFVIGCTHFGHANIIRLANRPFLSVEEMDEKLIENWNATVGPRDTVYHLGDFAFREALYYVGRLNGNLVPLRGNHDGHNWGEPYREIRFDHTKIVLCHYPLEEWNGYWNGSLHLHCHTHKTDFVSAPRRGNVTVEAIGYRPMALEEAVQILRETR